MRREGTAAAKSGRRSFSPHVENCRRNICCGREDVTITTPEIL
jgi:hypothetical protein